MTTPDPPYYTTLPDGRSVHLCTMRDHSRYWLNVGARLWVCEACHPMGGVEVKGVGEIMEAEGVEG